MNNIVMMRGRAMNRIMRPGINPTVKKPGFPIPGLGPELVVNGLFVFNSDWDLGSGWSISGGKARCDGTQPGTTFLSQTTPAVVGSWVQATFTIEDYVEGAIVGTVGSNGGVSRARNGTFTQRLIVEDNSIVTAYANEFFIGSVSLVSLKEVL
tara:strand:- start:89 stop:547 length:459 start_codon:yes stop_codon:yes gene_type:complete